MINIILKNIFKKYGSKEILHDVSANLPAGKVTAVFGASGAGKTTIARLIAGLERVFSGEIHFNDNVVSSRKIHLAPRFRQVAYLFQDLALLPHLNVQQNLETVLKAQKVKASERKKLVAERLAEFSLSGKEKRNIDELSGGEKQRVAIVRALLQNPQILILDEPFSALDTELKQDISSVIAHTIENYKLTTIIITHNLEEAFQFADHMLLVQGGRIVEAGVPAQIYFKPKSQEAAKFFGLTSKSWKSSL